MKPTQLLPLIALLAPALLATPRPAGDEREEALLRALDTITVPEVRADIEFIASDEMGGRDSPSPGLRLTARFIRSRLVHLGWQPGAEGGYFHEYSLSQWQMDDVATQAAWSKDGTEFPLILGEDYFLSPWVNKTRDQRGALVYTGEFDEEEIDGLELAGKWAVVKPGERISRRRQSAAEELGLLGFVVPADPSAEERVAESQGRWMDRMRAPSSRGPREGGIPTVYLAEAASERLLGNGGLADLKPGHAFGVDLREAYAMKELEGTKLENVCGLWPGSDPELRDDVIIVSAHYDHVGQRENGDVYNGADDNGSGTTGLLAIAEALHEYGPMRRTVMLIWVSAEEKGLLGSRAWTQDPWLPDGMRPVCDLNIDMIGRNAPDEIGITPTKEHPEYNRLTHIVEAQAPLEGFAKLNSADAYWSRSDHAMFAQNLKIPVAFLFSDVHEDYHQTTDTPDKIDCDKMRRVARLVVRMLHELQTDELGLELQKQ